jgi:hypothetical protein
MVEVDIVAQADEYARTVRETEMGTATAARSLARLSHF